MAKIAQRYNCTVKDLREWNNIKGSLLQIGQQLVVLEEVKIEEEEKVVYNLIEEEIVEKTPEIISEQVELAESLDTEINNKN